MEDLHKSTNTERKNRTVDLRSYGEEQVEDNITQKGKSEGIQKLSEKEAKSFKVTQVCEWSCMMKVGRAATRSYKAAPQKVRP